MVRAQFLTTLGAAAVLANEPDGLAGGVPVVLDGGRFFAVPRTVSGTETRWWLDTDGGGFILSDALRRLHLPDEGVGRARPPRFSNPSMPPADHLVLPVVDSREAASDPLLRGFDGQLGASWFVNHRWLFDYPRATLHRDASIRSASWVPVALSRGLYPRVALEAGGATLQASFDTAASVALRPAAVAAFHDGLPAVRATSFVKHALLERWHAAHPDWPILRNIGASSAIDAIRAPDVRVGAWSLGPQWFTTRPGDDVFEADAIALKLGAPAFSQCAVELDYPGLRLGVSLKAAVSR